MQKCEDRRYCSGGLHFSFFIFNFTSSFPDVYRHRVREGDAVGPVEGVEVHLTHADMEGGGGQGAQLFAPYTRSKNADFIGEIFASHTRYSDTKIFRLCAPNSRKYFRRLGAAALN